MGLFRNKSDIYESIGVEEGREYFGNVSQAYFSFQVVQISWDGVKQFSLHSIEWLLAMVIALSLCSHHGFPIEEKENRL